MRKAVLVCLMLFAVAGYAQQPPAANTEADLKRQMDQLQNRQAQMPRDLSEPFDKARQILENQEPAAEADRPAAAGKPARIGDPTRMTGSFTQALGRINAKPGAGGPGPAAAPIMPNIYLAAKAIVNSGGKSALIGVDGKNHLVKEGSKFTVLAHNTLHEILVNKIDRDHVDITVLPMGRPMSLQ